MIPMSLQHVMRPRFLRMLRDHTMRWDPTIRAAIDLVCRQRFSLTFDQMLERRPKWIAPRRCPRFIPSPLVLVLTIELVFNTCGNAKDAKTGLPLFSAECWKKARAVVELAREAFLSDLEGVIIYEKAGRDQYGLIRWWCLRGTGSVEGGPHDDIYRKFGALNGSSFLFSLL